MMAISNIDQEQDQPIEIFSNFNNGLDVNLDLPTSDDNSSGIDHKNIVECPAEG